MNATIVSIISGFLWGILGGFILHQWMPNPAPFYATFSGPFIGYFIYRISRGIYKLSWKHLLLWTLASTYISVAIFALALGIADALRPLSGVAWKVVVQAILNCLYGLTVIPFYWVLFPLAFMNHLLVRYLEKTEAEQGAAANP